VELPQYQLKLKKEGNEPLVFDPVRKKWVALTPEEWVRQHLVRYLIEDRGVPLAYLSVETALTVNGCQKRCDVIIYRQDFSPLVIVECKAPSVELTQKTFDQAATYNHKLGVDYFLLSNGKEIIFCRIDRISRSYKWFERMPVYGGL